MKNDGGLCGGYGGGGLVVLLLVLISFSLNLSLFFNNKMRKKMMDFIHTLMVLSLIYPPRQGDETYT